MSTPTIWTEITGSGPSPTRISPTRLAQVRTLFSTTRASAPGPQGPRRERDRAPGRGPGPGRPSPRHSPDDEVELELGFTLPNNTVAIPAALARLREHEARFGLFDQATADCVAVALTEALVNGIHHGNLELDSRLRREDEAAYERMAEFRRRRPPYRDRRLQVRARLSRRQAVYVIRDEGPGFEPAALPDPTDPAHLERTTGRACS